MTEKGRILYEEIEKAYEEYEDLCEIDVYDNMLTLLTLCSDEFLDCFTHEIDTTIDYDYDENDPDDHPSYEHPCVCFRLKNLPCAYFEVLCHGIVCCDDEYFPCPVEENNLPSVQAFLDYFIGKFGEVAGLKK